MWHWGEAEIPLNIMLTVDLESQGVLRGGHQACARGWILCFRYVYFS